MPGKSIKYSPLLNYINTKIRVKLDGSCLKQEKITFLLMQSSEYLYYLWNKFVVEDFALEKSLFGAVKLTKNVDFDGYKYSCSGIGTDALIKIHIIE